MAVRAGFGYHFGYQAVAIAPEVRDYSTIFATMSCAREFIADRGPYYDAIWVIIGPGAFYTYDGAPAPHALHRIIRDALLAMYASNTNSLTLCFPMNYVVDRSPLPTDQRGGYHAVLVQYPHCGPVAVLLSSAWCISIREAVRALRGMEANSEDSGPIFKAIVAGPEEIYDKDGRTASRELYQSVKGIACRSDVADVVSL